MDCPVRVFVITDGPPDDLAIKGVCTTQMSADYVVEQLGSDGYWWEFEVDAVIHKTEFSERPLNVIDKAVKEYLEANPYEIFRIMGPPFSEKGNRTVKMPLLVEDG